MSSHWWTVTEVKGTEAEVPPHVADAQPRPKAEVRRAIDGRTCYSSTGRFRTPCGTVLMVQALHCLEPVDLERFLERRTLPFMSDVNLAENLTEVLRKANDFVPSDAGSILLDDPSHKESIDGPGTLTFIMDPASDPGSSLRNDAVFRCLPKSVDFRIQPRDLFCVDRVDSCYDHVAGIAV